ncbi:MAG: CvfB family protein [Bacteroidales bacterium]
MVEIGKYNTLRVVKELDFGLYLDGGKMGEILLPRRYVPMNVQIDDLLEVFIYLDSEDRIIATTEMAYAQVGDFAFLRCTSTNRIGAFMDWGLAKDLLVPFREQKIKMSEERSYVVYVYLDLESQRIVASAKVEKYLDNTLPEYELNQQVELLIMQRSELGYKVIINNEHSGLLYFNEIFQEVNVGDRIPGYIKNVREDEKIDVSLQPVGYERIDPLSQHILALLEENEGFIALSDKSPAIDIEYTFSCSKKAFKKAIGLLYKQRLIIISEKGISKISMS